MSVIIPAFNAEPTIAAALTSVLAQDGELEVLVVDDASTDATVDIVSSFRDARIRLLRNERNMGPGESRNKAIAAARGQWITPSDADDRWAPNRLSSIAIHLEASPPEVAIVADRVEMDNGRQRRRVPSDAYAASLPRLLTPAAFVQHCMPGDPDASWGVLQPFVRRAFLHRHAIRYTGARLAEDFSLYVEVLLRGGNLRLVPEIGYFYDARGGRLRSDADYEAALVGNRQLADLAVDLQGENAAVVAALRQRSAALAEARRFRAFRELLRARQLAALSYPLRHPGMFGFIARRLLSRVGRG